jgi:hypothetical protein
MDRLNEISNATEKYFNITLDSKKKKKDNW